MSHNFLWAYTAFLLPKYENVRSWSSILRSFNEIARFLVSKTSLINQLSDCTMNLQFKMKLATSVHLLVKNAITFWPTQYVSWSLSMMKCQIKSSKSLIFYFEIDAKRTKSFSFSKSSLNNQLWDCTMNLRFKMKLATYTSIYLKTEENVITLGPAQYIHLCLSTRL